MSGQIRVGSMVRFQNLTCKVVGREGNFWVLQPNGARAEKITAASSQLELVLNEGHLETQRLEQYRQSMLYS